LHAPTQLLGHQIGPYRIVSFLGAGGMAEVFVGEHVDPQLARRVAIKALRTELCQDPTLVERFVNEARALGRIRHPGVVDVYEVDRLPDGRVCLVMELLRGETLSHYLAARGRLPVDEAVAIASQVAAAMRAAHHVGIIHRDLKPDNVFVAVEPEGLRVRVLDFGVAKLLDGAGAVVTGTKSTLGTAAYMAPEQFRSSRDVDARADIYALGCVLFQMLTGGPPYPAKGLAEQMAGHAFAPIPSVVERAGAPPMLDAILQRMLAKQRDDRYPSMDDVLHALTPGSVAAPAPPAAPPEAVARPVAGVETARVGTSGGRSWIALVAVAFAVGAAIAAGIALR
jgi:serine/threonine-protein kinase